LIAQACHASIAVIWEHRTDPDVIEYAEQAQQMRKVVLEAKDESQLNELSEKLNSQTFLHKLWVKFFKRDFFC
jgi:peptidyl-tRNA hydrolase